MAGLLVVDPREILVAADIRHFRQHLRKTAGHRVQQRSFEYVAVFCLGTDAFCTSLRLQGPYNRFVNVSHNQIRHVA